MRTIFIDADYKCHSTDLGGLTAIETNAFDGMCDAYIKGYRFVPAGKTWRREDGVEFSGEMLAPWKPYVELDAAQRSYEAAQLVAYENALAKIEAAAAPSVSTYSEIFTSITDRAEAVVANIQDMKAALALLDVQPEVT